jgi:hypothetical protein
MRISLMITRKFKCKNTFDQLHKWWDQGKGWKNLLNNLRLIIQPAVFYCLLSPWLGVFALPSLQQGFQSLIAMMNNFQGFVPV